MGKFITRHGHAGQNQSATYITWLNIRQRCHNPNNGAYERYGGRGIAVCDRWLNSFDAFLADMGEKPEGLTIERIDNNKGYSPDNCRWATDYEQRRNKRNSRYLTFDGQTKLLIQWAKDLGINSGTLEARLDVLGWTVERALTEPVALTKNRGRHYLTYDGKTQSMADWSKELGISYRALKNRINYYGWSVERALSTPVV